jgi:hypothetical protein
MSAILHGDVRCVDSKLQLAYEAGLEGSQSRERERITPDDVVMWMSLSSAPGGPPLGDAEKALKKLAYRILLSTTGDKLPQSMARFASSHFNGSYFFPVLCDDLMRMAQEAEAGKISPDLGFNKLLDTLSVATEVLSVLCDSKNTYFSTERSGEGLQSGEEAEKAEGLPEWLGFIVPSKQDGNQSGDIRSRDQLAVGNNLALAITALVRASCANFQALSDNTPRNNFSRHIGDNAQKLLELAIKISSSCWYLRRLSDDISNVFKLCFESEEYLGEFPEC